MDYDAGFDIHIVFIKLLIMSYFILHFESTINYLFYYIDLREFPVVFTTYCSYIMPLLIVIVCSIQCIKIAGPDV